MRPRSRLVRGCARAALLLLGVVSAIWSAFLLPALWSGAPAKDVAARILADDRFKPGTLSDVLASMQAHRQPLVRRSDVARSDALIRLRIAGEATARKNSEQADSFAAVADASLKSSLTLNPADSFLWLMLYSLEMMRNGFDVGTAGFLDQSYARGPLEGWIALRRNSLALAAFPGLSESIRNKVVSEFAGLVGSDFTEVAALNLMGSGWAQSERLLAGLVNVDLIPREAFVKRLSREGLKITLPGVEVDERLWRQ